jgi:two-component system nitrate/nitrite response regulator NarL
VTSNTTTIRLLLLDDHLAFRQPLAFMLDREPDLAVAAQAGSLAEARQAIGDGAAGVDVALIDLQLPDGNGADIIREMRAAAFRGQTLVLTADEDRVHHARAIEAGACGVLCKTADLDEIVDAIRRVHAGESVQSPQEVIDLLRLACHERDRDQGARETLASLTPRERQVLEALSQGLDNKAIGERLFISPETARTHVVKLLAKLNVDSRLQAAIFAIRHGIGTVS